ncbi:F5/8 type C domain-containing protein [Jiangella alba]|uniref:alpha-L-fucosidase n=2 Tax=Jiangella alba TaxID=561176 RepID=A0A1H5JAT6_9ACTN|nr:F5/8 type C domain-containing protein [Jiangella alba]
MLAVPAIVGAPVTMGLGASPASAAEGRPDVHDPGEVLASLRFGMFVHFNPSSVRGREIGWGRNAYRPGEPPYNQYRDPSVKADPVYDAAYREFLPERDWATKLAATAKAAGMKYLVFTAKHHDGYPNFRTDNVRRSFYTDFARTPMGRSGRDLTREIATATRDAGLKFGIYYSQRDWTQPDYVRGDYAAYYDYMLEHLVQLLTKYGKVDFMWYDHIPYADMAPFRPPLLNTIPRDLQQNILVNDRGYDTMGFEPVPPTLAGDYSTPEQRIGAFDPLRPWESCITITPGVWAWQPDLPTRDMTSVVETLVATSTGDGNLLLNVGPMKTGYIEDAAATTLREVGAWMAEHKASIVGTRGGPYRSGAVGGATYRDKTIYVHITDTIKPFKLRLPALNARVDSVSTLDGRAVPFEEDSNGDLLVDVAGLSKIGPDLVLELPVERKLTPEFATRETLAWHVVKPGTNLAAGKPVRQQSTGHGGVPERAVDGNTNGDWAAGTTTHTEVTREPWWQVDLGGPADLGQVWIYNRTGGDYGLRLSDFWVMASDTDFPPGDLATVRSAPSVTAVRIDGAAGDFRVVDLNGTGRFVRIQLESDNQALSLAEVEVYAR